MAETAGCAGDGGVTVVARQDPKTSAGRPEGAVVRRPFEAIAGFYARHRPPWPEPIFTLIAERFNLDGTGRLLDLGCGTGNVTLPLARYVDEAIGIDPEPDMLMEARAAAIRLAVTNVRWVEARAEDLMAAEIRLGLGQFRLVTMGAAFHWMDRERVLSGAHDVLLPGGGLAIIEEDTSKTLLRPMVDETLRAFLGTLYRHPARPVQSERHKAVVGRSRFAGLEIVTLPYQRVWNVDEIIGWVYSFSHGAYIHLGDRRASFEAALRERVAAIDPHGVMTEDLNVEVILARKT